MVLEAMKYTQNDLDELRIILNKVPSSITRFPVCEATIKGFNSLIKD